MPGVTPEQATSLLYAGEQYDFSSQQYYNRARWYNPLNGRFNRVDPYSGNMSDPQSLHKYTYVHANPVNGIDPSGKFTIPELCIASLIIGVLGILAVRSLINGTSQSYKYWARAFGGWKISNYKKKHLDKIKAANTYEGADIDALFDAYMELYPKVTSRACYDAFLGLWDGMNKIVSEKPDIAKGIKLLSVSLFTYASEPDNVIVLMPTKYISEPIDSVQFGLDISNKSGYDWYNTEAKRNIIFFYAGSVPFEPVGNLHEFVSSTKDKPSPYGVFNYLTVEGEDMGDVRE